MGLINQEIESLQHYQVSKHFTLYEAIASAQHPDLVEVPNNCIVNEIKKFAENELEEVRAVAASNTKLHIDSWYRNERLNRAVGGVHNSIHQIFLPQTNTYLGVAADVVPLDMKLLELFRNTVRLTKDLKTFILYPKRGFIHMDTSVTKNERTWMVSMENKSYTYVPQDQVADIVGFLREKFGWGQ